MLKPLLTAVVQQDTVVRSVWNEWSCTLSVRFSYVDLPHNTALLTSTVTMPHAWPTPVPARVRACVCVCVCVQFWLF